MARYHNINGVRVQFNVDGQSGYNETITCTMFKAYHYESDAAALVYEDDHDQAQGTSNIEVYGDSENDADSSVSGILHLFSPSNTTYVKHYYARFTGMRNNARMGEVFAAGYINVTGAIDEIKFGVSSGNFGGVIQMYGIA